MGEGKDIDDLEAALLGFSCGLKERFLQILLSGRGAILYLFPKGKRVLRDEGKILSRVDLNC